MVVAHGRCGNTARLDVSQELLDQLILTSFMAASPSSARSLKDVQILLADPPKHQGRITINKSLGVGETREAQFCV